MLSLQSLELDTYKIMISSTLLLSFSIFKEGLQPSNVYSSPVGRKVLNG